MGREANRAGLTDRRMWWVVGLSMVWLVLAAGPVSPVLAEEGLVTGPDVPCEGCPEWTQPPFPEGGVWYNPEQSGTGFMLEVQNGRLGGYYFLYDQAGQPLWYLIVGDLIPADDPAVAWSVEADLVKMEGGACLNCPYEPPVQVESAGSIAFEFMQRNFGRFQVDDGPVQNLFTLTHGVSGAASFPEVTPYQVPEISGYWSLAVEVAGPLPAVEEFQGGPVLIRDNLQRTDDGSIQTDIFPPTRQLPNTSPPAPPPDPIGNIRCGSREDMAGPVCTITLDGTHGQEFLMPLANLGDARFHAESQNGLALFAHRLRYD